VRRGVDHHGAWRLAGRVLEPVFFSQHSTPDGRYREAFCRHRAIDRRWPRAGRCRPARSIAAVTAWCAGALPQLLWREVEIAVDGLGAGFSRPAGNRQGKQTCQNLAAVRQADGVMVHRTSGAVWVVLHCRYPDQVIRKRCRCRKRVIERDQETMGGPWDGRTVVPVSRLASCGATQDPPGLTTS
jgi:hypothetical protein